jgi:hypothetical protein
MERGFRPKFKGTANAPAFYESGKSVRQRSDSSSNALGFVDKGVLLFGIVAAGVGMILYFESRKPVTHTGPALTVIPSSETDLAQIENMTQAVNALQQQHDLAHPSTPSAGVN